MARKENTNFSLKVLMLLLRKVRVFSTQEEFSPFSFLVLNKKIKKFKKINNSIFYVDFRSWPPLKTKGTDELF